MYIICMLQFIVSFFQPVVSKSVDEMRKLYPDELNEKVRTPKLDAEFEDRIPTLSLFYRT